MSQVVLDTSALLYWTLAPTTLPAAAARVVHDATSGDVVVSSISLWEIGLKAKRGTLDLGVPFDEYVQRLQQVDQLTLVPVDTRTWLRVVELPWAHRDPADRVIVATAQLLGAPLVTSDGAIRAYYELAVWDDTTSGQAS